MGVSQESMLVVVVPDCVFIRPEPARDGNATTFYFHGITYLPNDYREISAEETFSKLYPDEIERYNTHFKITLSNDQLVTPRYQKLVALQKGDKIHLKVAMSPQALSADGGRAVRYANWRFITVSKYFENVSLGITNEDLSKSPEIERVA